MKCILREQHQQGKIWHMAVAPNGSTQTLLLKWLQSQGDDIFAGSSGPLLLPSRVIGLGGGKDEGHQLPHQLWAQRVLTGQPVPTGAPGRRVTRRGSQLYL